MRTSHEILSTPSPILKRKGGAVNYFGSKRTWITKTGLLLFIYLVAITVSVSAQGPQLEWAKPLTGNVWDNGYAITVDDQGNTYTTGLYRGDTLDCDPGSGVFNLTPAGTAGNNLFITKLDAQGNFVWAKKFASTRLNYSYYITHDASSNIYVTGYFYDSLDFDPGPNSYVLHSTGAQSATTSDAFILKLDSAGNFLWARNIGGASNDAAYSIGVDSLDEVYVTGKFFGTVDFNPGTGTFNITTLTGGANIFVLKLDSAGAFMWAKNMGPVSSTAGIGSNGVGYALAVDAGGYVYTTGYFSDTLNFDPNGGQAYLIAHGTTINFDVFIFRLNPNGNLEWAKSIGSPLPDQGVSITLDPNRNVYVTGTFNSTADFDPGPGVYNMTASAAQNSDMFILKLSFEGDFLWAKDIGGTVGSNFSNNAPYSIFTDRAGNSYTAGAFFGYINCDTGSAGLNRRWIIRYLPPEKLAPSGAFKWVRKMGGAGIDIAHSVAIDGSGSIYATGWFQGTSNFNPSTTTAVTLTSVTANNPDIVVLKLRCGDTTSSILADTVYCSSYTLNGTTYTASGTYVQKLPNLQGCDSTITLHLTLLPNLNISVTRNGNVLGTTNHYTTYQWIRNGVAITGATDSTYTITQIGDYRVTVTNAQGCRDTSAVYHVTSVFSAGVISPTAIEIKIYPNPTEDIVNIQSPIPVKVAITDLEGRLLQEIENVPSFSIKSLASGIYILRITDRNGVLIKTVKMVKQ